MVVWILQSVGIVYAHIVDETKIPCTLLPEGPHTCGDCPAHAPYVPPVTPAPAASVVSL